MLRRRYLIHGALLSTWCVLSIVGCASAPDPTPQPAPEPTPDISNYVAYDDRLASAGAVTAAGLERLRDDGLERVIFIGYTSDSVALDEEDRIVDALGMGYAHVPVRGDAPGVDDFERFAAVMQQSSDRQTLVHCSSNRRASAFTMLYRVLYEDVPVAAAKADLNRVWTPNEIWTDFIRGVLEANGVDPDCDGCDWTPAPAER